MNCTKKGFDTEKAAIARIKEIAAIDDGREKPRRAYWCGMCEQWHLTKMPASTVFKIVTVRRGKAITNAVRTFSAQHKEKSTKIKKFKKHEDNEY